MTSSPLESGNDTPNGCGWLAVEMLGVLAFVLMLVLYAPLWVPW